MAASLTFDSAYRQVKRGQLQPVYYLTGDEDILKDELVALITGQAVEPASRDFNVDVRAAGDLDGESLHALVETPPMLAERRLVVLKNLEQWRKNAKVWHELERYVASPSPTTVLVMIHAAGEKLNRTLAERSAHVVVNRLAADRIPKWVGDRAKRVGLELAPDAVQHLVNALGDELSLLAMEIDKLAALAGDAPLDAAGIAPLVGVRRGETAGEWVSLVLRRDIPRALAALEGVLSAPGVTAVRLLGTLGTGLIGTSLARAALDSGRSPGRVPGDVFNQIRAARPYGLGDWRAVAGEWTAAAQQWTAAELANAIRAAAAADVALKSTTITDDQGTLSAMLLAIAPRRAAA